MSATTPAQETRALPRTARSESVPSKGARANPRLVSLLDPGSFEAESYRILCNRVEQMKRLRGVSVIAITSPALGDGKTTTAINLAAALAQSPGVRVLLVDADLRRPGVRTQLGMTDAAAGPGLVGAILDPALGIEAAARQRHPFNLSILTAGATSELPFELLRSERVGELLAEARKIYDHVILDTPPALVVPDCHALDRWVDGFLLVVAAGRTPRKLLAETLNVLNPEKVLGIVLNVDDRPLGGYGKYYSGYQRAADGSRKGPAGKGR
jgi:capsular exopolysaccharide synthesis family protein